ncbi:MAG TPA: DUF4037 domain-containing protein [Longimicrobium sp.]|nr:DUF4037 domain-containing protein [Longimicrobium sp.]
MSEPKPPFIPGLELSALFYREAVRPLLDARFPGLRHAAGRLGRGSDVLGFDTEMSMDHDWGPRLTLFLAEDDHAAHGDAVLRALGDALPLEVGGYPVGLDEVGAMNVAAQRPLRHGVEVTTVRAFLRGYLGVEAPAAPTLTEWLAIPAQRLRTVAHGRVFHDALGLEEVRSGMRWYPPDVWRYLLAAQWRRIAQEEAFVGRAGSVGDELGSRVLGARLVGEMMTLAFLCVREHPPYSKWFGTAFARLACAPRLGPALAAALDARDWREREARLSAAYVVCMEMQNALGLAPPVEARVGRFHGRPFQVPHADRFGEALEAAIESPEVRALPRGVGAVWQFAHSTDVLDYIPRPGALVSVYSAG